MILLHLTAPQWNARFVKSFHGQARAVIQSGFDQHFFEPKPDRSAPVIPESFDGIDLATFLDAYGNDRGDLEYLVCMCVKDKLDPCVVGLIAERHPEIAHWLVGMIQRQRTITAAFLAQYEVPGFPRKERPDNYAAYEGACLAAFARTRGHDILGEME